MRKLSLAVLLLFSGAALAQTPVPPPDAIAPLDSITVYSEAERQADESLSRRTLRSVLAPAETIGVQYARWKQPVCFNVYGLSATAKYTVERRMKDIAQLVGAPLDRDDPCVPNVTVIFTEDPGATLQSIARVRPQLVPGAGMIRSRLREAQPIQAWYSTIFREPNGRRFLVCYTCDQGWDQSRFFLGDAASRLHSGMQTEMGTVTVLADTKAIMGRSLGALADHFALISLSQARVTHGCKEVDTIANLARTDCDAALTSDAITLGDLALLTGLYKTPDDRLQNLHGQRIVGNMRAELEAQLRDRQRPANLDFER